MPVQVSRGLGRPCLARCPLPTGCGFEGVSPHRLRRRRRADRLLPEKRLGWRVRDARGLLLTWFLAREPASIAPDRFPIFGRIRDRLSMYGAPSLDGATVKATLDGRPVPAASPDGLLRELTAAEVAETELTVREFLPGLVPSIVRSDSYPDLFSTDRRPLIGTVPGRPRTYLATGFSGAGFKIASGVGALIARRALGQPTHPDLEGALRFADPGRFVSTMPR